jgi:hypothetical protein
MNNDNQNNTAQQQPQQIPTTTPDSSVQAQSVAPTPPTQKISPKESIKIRMGEIKHALGFDDPAKKKKRLIVVGAILGIFLLLTVGYALIPKQVATPLATLTPSPVGTEQPRGEPSAYANDPEVLRIMDALEAFDQEADQTKIREDDLRLPTVDWNISF